MGSEFVIILELDATAVNGMLDSQGFSKVHHIGVNCFWLQALCAKRVVLPHKIPGEENTADLTTKHFANAVILKSMGRLNLTHAIGRSEIAAELHAVFRAEMQDESQARETPMQPPFADY